MKFKIITILFLLTLNVIAQDNDKLKYIEIKKKIIDKTFENRSNGKLSYIKIGKTKDNDLKVTYKDVNNEYEFNFLDGYYLNGHNMISFDFYRSTNNSLYGTAFYNISNGSIDIKKGYLQENIINGNYFLSEEYKMKELDGIYSKRLKLLQCAEKPILRIFSNKEKYIYLYENNTSDFITYSTDSLIIERKNYNYTRSVSNNNGKRTKNIYFNDPLSSKVLHFIVESDSYEGFDVPTKLISNSDGLIYKISQEVIEKDYKRTNENLKYRTGFSSKPSWLKTPIDLLKSNPEQIINVYNYFYKGLQPNQIYNYYNVEKVDGQTGRKYLSYDNLDRKTKSIEIEIDEVQNIIYLMSKSKTNSKTLNIYAIDPILGPLPFIKSSDTITYFNNYKSLYKPTKNLNEFIQPNYSLTYREIDGQLVSEAISIKESFNNRKSILDKRINSSIYYLESQQIGKATETFKYFPPFSEKKQLYNAGAISISQLNNNDFYILKKEEVSKYGQFLTSLTGFNLFFSNQIEEFYPLQNGYGIFKYEGKMGVIDFKDEKWKNKNFITVENNFDEIKYIKPNVLKGIKNNQVLYFDYDGNILLSKTTKDEVLPADLTAKTVIDNYIKAIGGEEAIASVKTLMTIGSGSNPDLSFQLKFTNKVDSKGKLMIEIASATTSWMKQIVNEKEAYIMQRGQKEYIEGIELVKMKASAIPFEELILSSETDLVLSGVKKINGNDAYEIFNGDTTLYYDVKTGLKVQRIIFGEKNGYKTVEKTDYKDYREVKGVKIPYIIKLIKISSPSNVLDLEIKMSDVKINEGVSDADFQ
jgi:hypothetical protein